MLESDGGLNADNLMDVSAKRCEVGLKSQA